MKSALLSGAFGVAVLAAAPVAQAHPSVPFKQLAGPPTEMALMRAPDPAHGAVHSKAALVAVEIDPTAKAGATWTGVLPAERDAMRFMLLPADGASWDVTLVSPSGSERRASSVLREKRTSMFGLEGARVSGDLYTFEDLESGAWALRIEGSVASRGYVLIEGDTATELSSHLAHRRQLVGERIGVIAMLSAENAAGKAVLGHAAGTVDSASLRVTYPDGSVQSFPMFDDGRHGDGDAGDGIFGGDFAAHAAGDHVAQVVVYGRHADERPLLRTAEHLIPVVEASLRLGDVDTAMKAIATVDSRIAVRIPVQGAKRDGHYRAFAEVWGHDGKGTPTPVAWIGGMVQPDGGQLEFGLDDDWIALADARAPYELRNLRIEDPDHFITLVSAPRLALDVSRPARTKSAAEVVIDERMLMGPRPRSDIAAHKAGRLLLVHGYCSGGVWPTSQFSSASTFLDANQNRSHDQFARLIRDFGAQWSSFGIVAHSQGGAASLHLYTYYWSGLDYASGNRLIQSVGTPYQGTNLAGILAVLGNWFGVGCGTNSNLTYSGASSWLAGIPSWARSKVNYYTTSFATAWWRYDYCNMATDLVLSDPEDGTVERVYGQLSGALNRGHATGQCHTTGMRDPAQYLNASRNSTMNSNAAR